MILEPQLHDLQAVLQHFWQQSRRVSVQFPQSEQVLGLLLFINMLIEVTIIETICNIPRCIREFYSFQLETVAIWFSLNIS